MRSNLLTFDQYSINQDVFSHIREQLGCVVHHDNYFTEIFPVILPQEFLSYHLLKQIVCHYIKENIVLLLKGFNNRGFS